MTIDSGNEVAPRGGGGGAIVPRAGWGVVRGRWGRVRVGPRPGEAEKEAGCCISIYIISQRHLRLNF